MNNTTQLFCQLMKIGWNDIFVEHFTVQASSTEANADLVDWVIHGEIDDCCDRKINAWTAIQRESNLNRLLHFLRKSNGHINFADDSGRTILHVLLRNCHLTQKTRYQLVKNLLELGASVDAVDDESGTPLHIVTEQMDKSLMNLMIPKFSNVTAASGYQLDTILHDVVYACMKDSAHENHYTQVAHALIAKGANPNTINASGVTPLQLTVEFNFLVILRVFVASGVADFRQLTSHNETLLHLACLHNNKNRNNQSNIIDLLVNEGCDVNANDDNGNVPLHLAAKLRSATIVEHFVSLGCDVNARTKILALTPLHVAATFNRPDNLRLLLRAGGEVNGEDKNGMTALHITAASTNHFEQLKLLIEAGAEVRRRERIFGFASLHFAASAEKTTVHWLLLNGADVRQLSYDGLTALHLASLAGNVEVVRVLIERGAEVDGLGGNAKTTPLHLAVMRDNAMGEVRSSVFRGEDLRKKKFHGCFDWIFNSTLALRENVAVVECLIENGADVNAKDAIGRTPLHLATSRGESDMIEMLLKLGANVDEVDDEGRSPGFNALRNADTSGLKCLLRFGMDVNVEDYLMIGDCETEAMECLINHAIKLKILGLPVRDYLYNRRFNEMVDYKKRLFCNEMEQLKCRVIDGSDVSLYDFLRANARLRARLAETAMNMDLDIEFPEYRDVVMASCQQATNRISLLGPAMFALRRVTNVCWPEICVDGIIKHLNDRRLRTLIESDL